MKKILGIDTGGTYTDMVVVNATTKEVLAKLKTKTEKYDLAGCIKNGFKRIDREHFADISMVCLSTTLATNAIVENHGCKTGLVLIGGKPRGVINADYVELIKGKYDIKGREKENLDIEEVNRVVESLRDKVDAIAISGYASVRNPKHELYVKSIVEQNLGIPVVCAHDLTSTLGFYERTITAVLNAKLIPLICELMDAVKHVMGAYEVDAPLMVVKGDGSLMTEVQARNKPVETIMSGPASSIMGGVHLSGEKDAFIVDMGGTTTDIATVSGGIPKIRKEGAKVGGWLTRVSAAEVYTLGLGGDSRIYIDGHGKICIGPEKSIPLTIAASEYPELEEEIKHIYREKRYKNFRFHDHEAYLLIKKHKNRSYTDDEEKLIEILKDGPRTKDYLKNHIGINKLQKILDGMTKEGVVARISVTPTDVLHVMGAYDAGKSPVASIVLDIAVEKYGCENREMLIEAVSNLIAQKIKSSILEAALYFEGCNVKIEQGNVYDLLINKLFFDKNSDVLEAEFKIPKKIVGIGAPAGTWIASIGEALGEEVFIPEHAEVANAVGAAVGKETTRIEVLIRPDTVTQRFVVFSPIERAECDTLEEATRYAKESGMKVIESLTDEWEYEVQIEEKDLEFVDKQLGRSIFMERRIVLKAQINR